MSTTKSANKLAKFREKIIRKNIFLSFTDNELHHRDQIVAKLEPHITDLLGAIAYKESDTYTNLVNSHGESVTEKTFWYFVYTRGFHMSATEVWLLDFDTMYNITGKTIIFLKYSTITLIILVSALIVFATYHFYNLGLL